MNDLSRAAQWEIAHAIDGSTRGASALAKAEEYGRLAARANTGKERGEYERLRDKWLGIAEGWRIITETDAKR